MTITLRAIALLGTSTVLTSAAQLTFRLAMRHHDMVSVGVLNGWASLFRSITFNDGILLMTGILLYAISMLVWIVVLSKFDVSLAYPMMSVSYIIVFFLAVLLPQFNESVSLSKLSAVGLVVAGVVCLSFDDRRPAPQLQ